MEAHYRPNWRLTQARGLAAYNCGYAERAGVGTFHDHQQALVWRLLRGVDIDSRCVVLDVGSGIGGPARWIVERFRPGALIGVEYLWSSVSAARAAAGEAGARFMQGDAHALPIADASADVVFNLESALHYADKRRFLEECRRVLKPGGVLCLGDITTFRKRLFALAGALNWVPSQFNSNVRLWSRRDYERAMAGAGLRLSGHEDATRPVADSLADGLKELRRGGWRATAGFRGRFVYLAFLEGLLRSRLLRYDLFCARRA